MTCMNFDGINVNFYYVKEVELGLHKAIHVHYSDGSTRILRFESEELARAAYRKIVEVTNPPQDK